MTGTRRTARAPARAAGAEKIESLTRRYRSTHFVMAKWDATLEPFEVLVRDAVAGLDREARFDLIRFPADARDRFVGDRGEIRIDHDRLEWVRVGPGNGGGTHLSSASR